MITKDDSEYVGFIFLVVIGIFLFYFIVMQHIKKNES